ncbi:leucine zipper domain-containing protein [Micromonospora sp. CPCC 206061]
MTHKNAPLSVEGRRRLVERRRTRSIAHVAVETRISRACASKWVNRYRRCGELGLHDRSSVPHTRSQRLGNARLCVHSSGLGDGCWSARTGTPPQTTA